jgi:hypothetical protein
VASLPITLYSKKIGGAFDLLKLSKLEKLWVCEPVYIFDDNRLFFEKNFTFDNVFQTMDQNS